MSHCGKKRRSFEPSVGPRDSGVRRRGTGGHRPRLLTPAMQYLPVSAGCARMKKRREQGGFSMAPCLVFASLSRKGSLMLFFKDEALKRLFLSCYSCPTRDLDLLLFS